MNQKKLANYLSHNVNVLLIGAHGVGKTEVVKKIFNEAGLKWKYFSAATMDPWVDFIGIPRAHKREDGSEVLNFIKPAGFADDEVEALFFDEFNRAPEKVTNAVMELIQFKSINGHVFKNLKVVWAAINPYDEENTYHVTEMDPAVQDRFPIQIEVAYQLDAQYLRQKYQGDEEPFVKWWKELPVAMQKKISPRRLDHSVMIYKIGGDLKDVFPRESNVAKLLDLVAEHQKRSELLDVLKKTDEEKEAFFTIERTRRWAKDILNEKNDKAVQDLVVFFHGEILEQMALKDRQQFSRLIERHPKIQERLSDTLCKELEQKELEKFKKETMEVEKGRSILQTGLMETIQASEHVSLKVAMSRLGARYDVAMGVPMAKREKASHDFFNAFLALPNSFHEVVLCGLGKEPFTKTLSQILPENGVEIFMGVLLRKMTENGIVERSRYRDNVEFNLKRFSEISSRSVHNCNRDAVGFLLGYNQSLQDEVQRWLQTRNGRLMDDMMGVAYGSIMKGYPNISMCLARYKDGTGEFDLQKLCVFGNALFTNGTGTVKIDLDDDALADERMCLAEEDTSLPTKGLLQRARR